MDPLMTDAEVLLSSLLGEAPSIWLDDLSSSQDGGKNTTKAGEAETLDLFRELEQDSLLGNTDPLPEWMSEKVSLTQWLEVADMEPSDILMESPLPSDQEKLDLGTIPTEELLNTLIVDTRYAPQAPSPGEAQAPDLLALSPTSSIFSEELSLPPSPSSPYSTHFGSPGSPVELFEEQATMLNLTTIDASEVLQSMTPTSPAASIENGASAFEHPELATLPFLGDVTLATVDASELLHGFAPSSPASSNGEIPMTFEGSSIEVVVVETPKKDIQQPKSKARPKVKSVSNPVIRKSKKRDQNKRAATRYRQKKRGEHGLLEDEQMHLEKTNKDLHDKVDSISREIKYLKDLLVEVYKVKGEIKVLRKK